MKSFATIVVLVVTAALYFSFNDQVECTIAIENIKGKEGKLVIAVFDNEDDYLKNDLLNKEVVVTGKPTELVKLKLPRGEYAIAVFHDINGNKELDKNMVGWPQEAFGFSNKSLGMFGPPSFKETKFTVPSSSPIKVKLKHL